MKLSVGPRMLQLQCFDTCSVQRQTVPQLYPVTHARGDLYSVVASLIRARLAPRGSPPPSRWPLQDVCNHDFWQRGPLERLPLPDAMASLPNMQIVYDATVANVARMSWVINEHDHGRSSSEDLERVGELLEWRRGRAVAYGARGPQHQS